MSINPKAKKMEIKGSIIYIFVISSMLITIAQAQEDEQVFTLNSWEATIANNTKDADADNVPAVLRLNFNLSQPVDIELKDGAGNLLDSHHLYADENTIDLELVKKREFVEISQFNPLPGKYLLKVRSNGKLVSSREFLFQGGALKLAEDNTSWVQGCAGGFDNPNYTDATCIESWVADLNFTLKNTGDLPIFISMISNIRVDGGSWLLIKKASGKYEWSFDKNSKQKWDLYVGKWVLPGKTRLIFWEPRIIDSYRITDIPKNGKKHQITFDLQHKQKDLLLSVAIDSPY
jgi:hypothetical protein